MSRTTATACLTAATILSSPTWAQTAPGAAEPAPVAVTNNFSLEASTGVDYSVGKYGGTTDTTVFDVPFGLKIQADRLATRLRGQGLEARVIGKKKPFRVRVGHYLTHSDAFAALKKIDAIAKSNAFVVLIGPEEK